MIVRALWLAGLVLSSATAFAQDASSISITANSCIAVGQSLVPAGSFAIVSTDGNDVPIPYGGAGYQALAEPVVVPINNGSISPIHLPNPSVSSPSPVFRITITNAVTRKITTYRKVGISLSAGNTTWSFCQFQTGSVVNTIPENILRITDNGVPVTAASVRAALGGSPALAVLADGGNFVAIGDSLATGHGLSGFASPGYPNVPPAGAWPEVLSNLPIFLGRVNVTNEAIDGIGLATMVSNYPSAAHALAPAVTGKPGVIAVTIYGNDAGSITSITNYEAQVAAFYSTLHADGWKILFLEQWPQGGRQQYDANRVHFNEWNKQNADCFLPTVGRMNTPTNQLMYQPDGQHPTALSSYEIAMDAQNVLLTGGAPILYGSLAPETLGNEFPVTADVAGNNATSVRNTNFGGYSAIGYKDNVGNVQVTFGFGNPGTSFEAGHAYMNTLQAATPFDLCLFGDCRMTLNPDGSYALKGTLKMSVPAGDLQTVQNTAHTGYSSEVFLDEFGVSQLSTGYSNGGAAGAHPGASFVNSRGSYYVCANNQCGIVINPDNTVSFPAQKATTGTVFACFDTNGNIVRSATACSGT